MVDEGDDNASEEHHDDTNDNVDNRLLSFVLLSFVSAGDDEADTGDNDVHHGDEENEVEDESDDGDNERGGVVAHFNYEAACQFPTYAQSLPANLWF